MPMQLILKEDVDHLGKAGDLVSVKSGYGRNYLIPQGLAISATKRNQAELEHNKRIISRRVAKEVSKQRDGVGDIERTVGVDVAADKLLTWCLQRQHCLPHARTDVEVALPVPVPVIAKLVW